MCAPPLALLKGEPGPTPRSTLPDGQTERSPEPGRQALRCKVCQAEVADERDVFSASAEGPVGAYINPAGFLHEIVTLRAVVGVRLVGPAVTRASWFVGYTWTIVNCASCQAHLGWQFDALEGQSPPVFWGLRRGSITGC